jgi:hypothetical protein
MVEDLFFHEFLLLALLWLCVILYGVGRRCQTAADQAHGNPAKRATRRSQAPKPFPGLTTKPRCGACEREPGEPLPAAPPARLHSCAPQILCTIVTLPSFQVYIHGATH